MSALLKRMEDGLATEGRGMGTAVVYLVALVAILALIWGSSTTLKYLWATAPSAEVTTAVATIGIVTAQREELQGRSDGYFPNVRRVQLLSFAFVDRDGGHQTGEDEVSAIYYRDHPTGSSVEVFYLLETPNRSVIGSAERLALKMSVVDLVLGTLTLVVGGIGLVWASNRWLMIQRGFGFL